MSSSFLPVNHAAALGFLSVGFLFGTEFSFLTAHELLNPTHNQFHRSVVALALMFILMALPTLLTRLRLAILTAQDIIAVISFLVMGQVNRHSPA